MKVTEKLKNVNDITECFCTDLTKTKCWKLVIRSEIQSNLRKSGELNDREKKKKPSSHAFI